MAHRSGLGAKPPGRSWSSSGHEDPWRGARARAVHPCKGAMSVQVSSMKTSHLASMQPRYFVHWATQVGTSRPIGPSRCFYLPWACRGTTYAYAFLHRRKCRRVLRVRLPPQHERVSRYGREDVSFSLCEPTIKEAVLWSYSNSVHATYHPASLVT